MFPSRGALARQIVTVTATESAILAHHEEPGLASLLAAWLISVTRLPHMLLLNRFCLGSHSPMTAFGLL